jgi:hypothetical protein
MTTPFDIIAASLEPLAGDTILERRRLGPLNTDGGGDPCGRSMDMGKSWSIGCIA